MSSVNDKLKTAVTLLNAIDGKLDSLTTAIENHPKNEDVQAIATDVTAIQTSLATVKAAVMDDDETPAKAS